VGADPEHLEVPLAEATAGIEARFEDALRRRVGPRNLEGDRLESCRGTSAATPAAARVAELDAANGHDPPQQLLERTAHRQDVVRPIDRVDERRKKRRQRLASIALTRQHGLHAGTTK
jgi:hypothetical protein